MLFRSRAFDNSYYNYYGYGYGGRDWKTYAAHNNLACTQSTFKGRTAGDVSASNPFRHKVEEKGGPSDRLFLRGALATTLRSQL